MSTSNNLTTNTVWFVTGCSSGLGAALCKHILASGHNLVATARNPSSLWSLPPSSRLLTLALDITSPSAIKAAFAAAVEKFGRVDVVVNNAGYALMGDTEAAPDEAARKQLDTNFWGTVDVSKEAVRVMREANGKEGGRIGGTVVQISSMGGWVAFPGNAFYHASKFAVEGFTESFAKEMHPDWNINFLIIEPGGVSTNFGTTSLTTFPPHPAYTDPSMPTRKLEVFFENGNFDEQNAKPEDVVKVAFDVIVKQGDRKLPLRLPLGLDVFGMVKGKLDEMNKIMDEWKDVSGSTIPEERRKIVEGWVSGTAK